MKYQDPKIIYGITGLVALCLLFIPIRNTIALVYKYNGLQNAVSQLDLSSPRVRHNAAAQSLLDQSDDGFKKIVESISLSSQANHVIVKRFDPPQYTPSEDILIQHQQITLEGSFVNILKCLDTTNDTLVNVKITAVKFDLEENNKKTSLLAKVVYQSVKIPVENE